MIDIKEYIFEKFRINKDTELSDKKEFRLLDDPGHNEDFITAVINSTYISLYKNYTFKRKGLAQYSIKKSEINWEDIIELLKTEYNYIVEPEDIKNLHSKFRDFTRPLLGYIEDLVNMKKVWIKKINTTYNGHDIYWKIWKPWAEKHPNEVKVK